MDGNRRWAKQHGLAPHLGHREGYKTLEEIGDHCLKLGVRFLTVYAFSTENWRRSPQEIRYLLKLIRYILKRKLQEFVRKGVQLKFLGRLFEFPKDVQKLLENAVEATKHNRKFVFNIALNYGGRAELIDAFRAMLGKGLRPQAVTENTIAQHLYTAGEPDPDLVIRTSGVERLSNYLLWQSAYSEFIVSPKLWPDFKPADLDAAIEEFRERKRNFGR